MYSTLVLTFLFCISSTFHGVLGAYYKEKYESFLSTSVYSYYDKRIRPRLNQSQNVEVELSLSVVSVNGLDASSGTLELVSLLTVTWENELLVYNYSTDWSELEAMLLSQANFWRPTLVLYNSVATLSEIGDKSYRIRIDSNGTHEWRVGLVTSSACSVDVTYFPFDTQTCELTFTPWAWKSFEVSLKAKEDVIDLTHYSESVEWTYLNGTAEASTEDDQAFLKYKIKLARSPGFFFVNLVMPVVVVAVLNVVVFLLPAECGERVGYSVTIYLTFAVYLDIVTATLPQSSETISKLASYLIAMVCIGAMTTIMTIVSLFVYHRDEEKPIPKFIEAFVTCLCCRCGSSKQNTVAPSRTPSPNERSASSASNEKPGLDSRQNSMDVERGETPNKKSPLPTEDIDEGKDEKEKEKEEEEEEEEEKSDDALDWHGVANALDFLFAFLIFWFTFGLSCYYLIPLAVQ